MKRTRTCDMTPDKRTAEFQRQSEMANALCEWACGKTIVMKLYDQERECTNLYDLLTLSGDEILKCKFIVKE